VFWKLSEAKIPEITETHEFDALLDQDLAVVFKHSHSCTISWLAHAKVSNFMSRQPEVSIHLVSVRRQREVSRHIAHRCGVEHASPQILVIRRGTVVAHASHGEITAEFLAEAVRIVDTARAS
jgi:bacillithiol system protein YtxJ